MLVFQGNKLKKKKRTTLHRLDVSIYMYQRKFLTDQKKKKKSEFALQKWYCLHLVHKCEAEVKLHS